MNGLNLPTLLLNKSWNPVHVETVKDSFVKVFAGTAELIQYPTFQGFDFEQWAELPVGDDDDYVRTTGGNILAPKIVRLIKYDRIPIFDIKLTRKNLLVRDGHRCCYTNEPLTYRNATIDHIMPQSRGGRHRWDNVVISSSRANRKKGARTPDEAGMPLLRKPYKPRWNPLYTSCVPRPPSEWNHLMKPYAKTIAATAG